MSSHELVNLPLEETDLWSRFFSVFPLVLIGTLEEDDTPDIAPKHLAMPLSWKNWFGFVCTPRHRTYHNAKRSENFTVSYPRPDQIIQTSLAAAPRDEDDSKPSLQAIETIPATAFEGVLVAGCSVYLECRLDRVIDELGENSLLIGEVIAARADPSVLRAHDRDDHDLLREQPLLAYLYPGQFTPVAQAQAFPFHAGFCR